MPQVLVWKCPETGKLFEHKDAYRKHLRIVARNRLNTKKWAVRKSELDEQMAPLYRSQDLHELVEWINENGLILYKLWDFENNPKKMLIDPKKFKLEIYLERMKWNDCVSNSHSAPKGKPTNFGRDLSKPRGYPGWYGYLRGNATGCLGGLYASDLLKQVINTGSGGGGNDNFGFDVKIFADDFPLMAMFHKIGRPADFEEA